MKEMSENHFNKHLVSMILMTGLSLLVNCGKSNNSRPLADNVSRGLLESLGSFSIGATCLLLSKTYPAFRSDIYTLCLASVFTPVLYESIYKAISERKNEKLKSNIVMFEPSYMTLGRFFTAGLSVACGFLAAESYLSR